MSIFKDYPSGITKTLDELREQFRLVCNIRKSDITQINNLTSAFVGGRKVGKVPSASNDVVAALDKIGDFNVTKDYAYYLIDNAGTPEWRRVAVGSW